MQKRKRDKSPMVGTNVGELHYIEAAMNWSRTEIRPGQQAKAALQAERLIIHPFGATPIRIDAYRPAP
jgi:hypothetical protein